MPEVRRLAIWRVRIAEPSAERGLGAPGVALVESGPPSDHRRATGGALKKQSVFALARQLVSGFVTLAKLEFQHGRQEIGVMLAGLQGAAVLLGIAFGFVFAALITVVVALILGLAALTGLPPWLMAVIVFVVLLSLAALLAWRGLRRIHVGAPEETIASVKEDMAWARRLMRRD
ncbi:MAG: phage holin family protein [Chloroflexi bacterium]|nr:MAG: phage holin family protein [Chloroflexota bacterium]